MYSLLNSVTESGIGLFSGRSIQLTLSPSFENGIWFKNKNGLIELLSPEKIIVDNHNTSLSFPDGSNIKLIEHLLSAVFAFGISDILISVNDDEIPIFDGSSSAYIFLLSQLKLKKKNFFKYAVLNKKIRVTDGGFFVEAKPSLKITLNFSIDFKSSVIGKEKLSFAFSKKNYIKEISTARTFGFIEDFELARSVYKGATLENTIVISNNTILSTLRMKDELVRHKILDALGDLRCFPVPILMKYSSFGGSHKLNNILLKEIIKQDAFEIKEVFIENNNYLENESIELIKSYA